MSISTVCVVALSLLRYKRLLNSGLINSVWVLQLVLALQGHPTSQANQKLKKDILKIFMTFEICLKLHIFISCSYKNYILFELLC